MTELKNEEVIPSIIAAAIAAAGPMGNNPGAWKGKVNAAIPHIAAMLNDGTRQWKIAEEVLTAHVFTGKYVSHSLEESSTRMLVLIDSGKPSKRYEDGIEPIRSHRTDNAQGRAMAAVLDQLEPGQDIVVWRAMESMGDGVDANKVRTLVHLETRAKRSNQTPAGNPSPPPAREQRSVPPPAAAPEPLEPRDAAPAPYSDQIDTERLRAWRATTRETLTNAEFGELALTLMETGYDFDGVSEIEWVDHVRPLIRGLINNRET